MAVRLLKPDDKNISDFISFSRLD